MVSSPCACCRGGPAGIGWTTGGPAPAAGAAAGCPCCCPAVEDEGLNRMGTALRCCAAATWDALGIAMRGRAAPPGLVRVPLLLPPPLLAEGVGPPRPADGAPTKLKSSSISICDVFQCSSSLLIACARVICDALLHCMCIHSTLHIGVTWVRSRVGDAALAACHRGSGSLTHLPSEQAPPAGVSSSTALHSTKRTGARPNYQDV